MIGKKRLKWFIKAVNNSEASKVKIAESSCYGTYKDGLGTEIPMYRITFDGGEIPSLDKECHIPGLFNEDLLSEIIEYFVWSSQKIKELEAKLALARITQPEDN